MVINFLIGAACGFLMWALIKLEKDDYKELYALYLAVIAAGVLGITFSFKTVFAAGVMLVAYTIFLAIVDPPFKLAFALPNIWLSIWGLWLIRQNGSGLGTSITFAVIAILACIYPFMEYILHGHAITDTEDDASYEEKVLAKNKRFAYLGIIIGLIRAILYVLFH